jgi:small-conductance mechanosensitive channel
LLLDAKIRAFEDLMDSQFELNKAIGEALEDNGEFTSKLADIVNKHLDRENEIFDQMNNFLKEKGENKDETL